MWPVVLLLVVYGVSGCADLRFSPPGSAPAANPASQRIQIVPSAIDFKNVVVGQQNTQAVQITNTQAGPVLLTKVQATGGGFSLSAMVLPVWLAPGASQTFTLAFAPGLTGAAQGMLAVYVGAQGAPATVPLQGSGEKPNPQLQLNPASLTFGTVELRSSASQGVTLTNTGNENVTITGALTGGPDFTVTGLPAAFGLAPQQQIAFQVAFHPQSSGAEQATLSVSASSIVQPILLALAGAGRDAPPPAKHAVKLRWLPSEGASGYLVYRSQISGGPYSRLTPEVLSAPEFLDANVEPRTTYFYVVTAVQDNLESGFSGELAVQLPPA